MVSCSFLDLVRPVLTRDVGPRYVVAFSVNCVMSAMAICAALILRIILVRLNKKLDQGIYVEGAINTGADMAGFRFKI
jgi:hypothetical protein